MLNEDKSVWAAGLNQNGQLGEGSKTDRNSFVKAMPDGAVAVVTGGFHSMVLKEGGSVWTTGSKGYG